VDSFRFPNGFPATHLGPGQSVDNVSDPLDIRGTATSVVILGQVTINGVTQARSTQLRVTRS